MAQHSAFFAYPSNPSLAETIKRATYIINSKGTVSLRTWEDCKINGKIIIDTICQELVKAEVFCADVTHLNPNVFFELGYAIAANKRIWLIRDPSFTENNALFEKLKILTTLGYSKYSNADDIVRDFYNDNPFDDIHSSVFTQSIEPSLPDVTNDGIFFLKSFHHNQANVDLVRSLEKMRQTVECPIIYDDPRETGSQPLVWYGMQVYDSKAVVCHLMNLKRENSLLHNAKTSLVAGMAMGMQKRLLILIEDTLLGPIDYRDIQKSYQTATEAVSTLHGFIGPLVSEYKQRSSDYLSHTETVKLATKLKSLRMGDPIAENESTPLVSQYFIDTAAFDEARSGKHTIFVGRKGVGKTANLLKLNDSLGSDKRNLVCVIKPLAYDLQGLVELIRSYKSISTKSFALESIWKFLLYSEIANSTALAISTRPGGNINENEIMLLDLLGDENSTLRQDFTIRLERCVTDLLKNTEVESLEDNRVNISETLHSGILRQLRQCLGEALQGKEKIFVLVDNLDKAWDKQADVEILTDFFLGLLSASNRVRSDFNRIGNTDVSLNMNLCVFVRADIFQKVLNIAREPDKIPFYRMSWNDKELLLRLIDERMVSSPGLSSSTPDEIWKLFFAETVRSLPVREYIFSRINQKPRDLLYFIKAALTTAVNRKHPKVTESDFIDAEKQYAQFALESILVENGLTVKNLESVVFEFVGSDVIITHDKAIELITAAGIPDETPQYICDHLCGLAFFGIEVHTNDFRFSDDLTEIKRNKALSSRLIENTETPFRLKINPAYWAYLEAVE